MPNADNENGGERFIILVNHVVLDIKTGLEWKAGSEHVDYRQAKQWIQRLNEDGEGWRLPSMKELKSLYKKGMGTRDMTPLVNENVWRFWPGEEGQFSSTAWTLNFYACGEMKEHSASGVLAVRPRNDE